MIRYGAPRAGDACNTWILRRNTQGYQWVTPRINVADLRMFHLLGLLRHSVVEISIHGARNVP